MGLLGDLGKNIAAEMRANSVLPPKEDAKPDRRPKVERMTIALDTYALGGRPHRDMKKLEKLLADGWEIDSQHGAVTGTKRNVYVLRRER